MSSKIKLLIVTPSLACGGAERNVVHLCNHLNLEIFDVVLVILDNSQPFYTIKKAAITCIDLKQPRVIRSLGMLKETIHKHQPDIVLSTANHLNLLFAIFRNRFSKKIKWVFRETSIMSINSKRAKLPAFYDFLLRRFYHRADRIVCQSTYMKQDLATKYRIPENKLIIIHNAVEVPLHQELPKEKKTIPHFITVARLSEEKGIERIIRALVHLKFEFSYTIIGEGPERNNLETLIEQTDTGDCIQLVGAKEYPYNWVAQPDLLLIGSYYEGFPNVVLEANSIGIPVVAFKTPGGIEDVIVEGENGFLVEDGNIFGFAEAINKAMTYSFNHENIRQTTSERYNPHQVAFNWENLFKSLLETH